MTISDCRSFDSFEAYYGQAVSRDVLERICESAYRHPCPPLEGVTLETLHRHDAVNMTFTGSVLHEGVAFHFEIDDGDWGGTVVRAFSTEPLSAYVPPEPVFFTLVPVDELLKTSRPAMYEVFLAWAKADWFLDLVRGYNYDRRVQPGCIVEAHYWDKASRRGLKFVTSDSPAALQVVKDLEGCPT